MKNIKTQKYRLFIDELGVANPKDVQSDIFIIAGCSVNEDQRSKIKERANQIKFKYWNRTDVVFHSREIGRRMGDFRIFKKSKIFKDFILDLEKFLEESDFKMFFVIVDKNKTQKVAWSLEKICEETSKSIIKNFLFSMVSQDSKGKICVEASNPQKDYYFLKANQFFLSGGIFEVEVDCKKIQNTITSLAFVTKNNFDIEEQLADIFAYAAKCRYFDKIKKNYKSTPYEEMILRLFKKKLYKKPRNAGSRKKKYLDKIKPFEILP